MAVNGKIRMKQASAIKGNNQTLAGIKAYNILG